MCEIVNLIKFIFSRFNSQLKGRRQIRRIEFDDPGYTYVLDVQVVFDIRKVLRDGAGCMHTVYYTPCTEDIERVQHQ